METVTIISLGTGGERDEALATAVSTTAGVIIAKQLVAAPANVMTPGFLFGTFLFLLLLLLASRWVIQVSLTGWIIHSCVTLNVIFMVHYHYIVFNPERSDYLLYFG